MLPASGFGAELREGALSAEARLLTQGLEGVAIAQATLLALETYGNRRFPSVLDSKWVIFHHFS